MTTGSLSPTPDLSIPRIVALVVAAILCDALLMIFAPFGPLTWAGLFSLLAVSVNLQLAGAVSGKDGSRAA